MQLDHDVAGARKLVPAVWPWSMLLRTGDRVQLCGLIIYSYNTATLETSGTHCIYLHSCVVALMLGFCAAACVRACVRLRKQCRPQCPPPSSLKLPNAQGINHPSTPNHEQHDYYETPPAPPSPVYLSISSPYNALY